MKGSSMRRVMIFDYRGEGLREPCDTLTHHDKVPGAIGVYVTSGEGGTIDAQFSLCEICAFSNPIVGIMLENLEEWQTALEESEYGD